MYTDHKRILIPQDFWYSAATVFIGIVFVSTYNPFYHSKNAGPQHAAEHHELHAKEIAQKAWSAQFLGSPLVWLAVTLIMIAVGFGWLENFVKPRLDNSSVQTAAEIKNLPDKERDPYEEIAKEPFLPITADSDDPRAAIFRELEEIEAAIGPLQTKAKEYMDLGQLTYPPSENAWETYAHILELDADESSAEAGQNRILAILDGEVESAIERADYETAESWIEELDRIRPDNPAQILYRERISASKQAEEARQAAKELQKEIDGLLLKASAARDNPDLGETEALRIYRSVLELNPKQEAAREGIRAIAARHLSLAIAQIQEGNFDTAANEIKLAEIIDPETAGLVRAKRNLNEARQRYAASQNAAEAQKRELEEEQRLREEAQRYEEERKKRESSPLRPSPDFLGVGILAYYRGNYPKAYELLQPLAANGIARAQFRLGMMYILGRGVAQNRSAGESWIAKALPSITRDAQNGVAWAQTDLGTAYEIGITLNRDMERAIYWYTQAAEKGYAGAQTNLGVLYGTGDGVPRDREKAIYWFEKAAVQGDTIAKENLQILKDKPVVKPDNDLDSR